MTIASSRSMTEIALLRIEVDEVTPAVIRRVEVPVTIRLDDLHFVLQIAIGWQNCHPFEFRVGETAWGLLDRDDPESSPRAARPRHWPTCSRSQRRSGTTTCTAKIGDTRSSWRRSS